MKRNLLFGLLLLALVACAPGATSVVAPPTFRVIEAQTSLVKLEPAGIGQGGALIHLELEARNPNPFPLHLAGLDGDFYLGDQRVAGTSFRQGISLSAGGTSRLGLDIEVPVSGAPQLLSQLARLVSGDGTRYRVDATVSVDVLGAPQQFPSLTVAQGELRVPGGLRPPTVRLDPGATQVRLSGLNAQIDVALVVDNPLPLGYWLRGPRLGLQLDGRPVGNASLPRVAVPASSSTTAVLRFELGFSDLGAAILTRLQGGATGMRLALDGELALEIPGIASTGAPLSLDGTLR